MPGNKFVGRSASNNAGLILQSKPDITRFDYGMLQGTFRFTLRNENWPALDLPRGSSLDLFTAGDPLTADTLAFYGQYMGKQSSKFTRNGQCPGIGILEILAQGAVFDHGPHGYRISSIPIVNPGSGFRSQPTFTISGGGEITPALAFIVMRAVSASLRTAGTGYTAGDILTVTGGTAYNGVPLKIQVDTVSGGAIATFHALNLGLYTSVPNSFSFVSVTGGTGSNATFNVVWSVSQVVTTTGGFYVSTPTAAITGGFPNVDAILGVPSMAPSDLLPGFNATLTNVELVVTTVKDTCELTTYTSATTVPARVATVSLPPYVHGSFNGQDAILGTVPELFPILNGTLLNFGDRILLADGTPYAGLYRLAQVGQSDTPGAPPPGIQPPGQPPPDPVHTTPAVPWVLVRVPEMDESAEFTANVVVAVAEGSNAGSWLCTNSGSFTLNSTQVSFAKLTTNASLVPKYKIAIEYHAVEQHIEYMAKIFKDSPRWIRDEYQRCDDGTVLIFPPTTYRMRIDIDSVTARELSNSADSSGNVITTEGAIVAVNEDVWRDKIKYKGTAAQFDQAQSGGFWHVTEQATIKMVPIPQAGNITSG